MNILVIGSGGREHSICAAFARSSRVTKIFCAPGNAGIAEIAECVAIKPEQIQKLAEFAGENAIDLTFVGGESALVLGIVDEFERLGLRIVGASKRAAELEASKSFAKDFMKRHGIPTARYSSAYSPQEAVAILEAGEFGDETTPVVVKADGLAAGKGVVVAKDRAEAVSAINAMENLVGADAAASIVLEECLFGKEVSLLMFADGESFALMPPTRDYKRIGEGDTGPNTGGMGTITDASLLTAAELQEIIDKIIRPTLHGCIREGFPFRGILFLGLMMTDPGGNASVNERANAREPMLLEYNVRFGDPETQSILVRLETDLVEICEAMLAENRVSSPTMRENSSLAELEIKWKPGNSATVVLASKGYPEKPLTGDIIHGLENGQLCEDVSIFHAGTSLNSDGELVTLGGRVLGVTATADNLPEALNKAYAAVKDISWEGMQHRGDIGSK